MTLPIQTGQTEVYQYYTRNDRPLREVKTYEGQRLVSVKYRYKPTEGDILLSGGETEYNTLKAAYDAQQAQLRADSLFLAQNASNVANLEKGAVHLCLIAQTRLPLPQIITMIKGI